MATSADQQPTMLGVTAIKPVERHGWEAFKWFFWDPKRGAIMGRTPKSWGLITLFYIVFYSCLAAFWAIMLAIFFLFINDRTPRYIGEESLIGKSPGVGLRPEQPEKTLDSSMFIYNMQKEKADEENYDEIPGYGDWGTQIHEFLSNYDHRHNLKEAWKHNCSFGRENEANKPCRFDVAKELEECGFRGKDNAYGFKDGKPCVYLKLNKLMHVNNDHYSSMINSSKNFIPPDFPPELKAHINRIPQSRREQVWINCEGENPADKEAMGRIEYFPKDRGFPEYYFPYLGKTEGEPFPYESPLVAVKFHNPRKGVLIHVECRAWAKNIEYDRGDRKGMVRFELLIMDDAYEGVFGTDESYVREEEEEEEEPDKENKKNVRDGK